MLALEGIIYGIGLSMDALAASICKGVPMNKVNIKIAFVVASFFGFFQAIMPLIGYALASTFADKITAIDHWVAFFILIILGAKMIKDGIDKENEACTINFDVKELLLLALATSIDALAVGVSLTFTGANVLLTAALIGITTFVVSGVGVCIGCYFGNKFKDKAIIFGGIILILIGLKTLLGDLI